MKRNILHAVAVLAFLFSLASQQTSHAAVQPVVLFVNAFITNYTVPPGKVLLIEQLSAWAAGNVPTTSRILVQTKIVTVSNGGTLTTDWGFPVSDKTQDVTLVRPLRIPAGGSIGIDFSGNAAYNEIHMMGMLIDAADLYAANVSGAVQDVKVAGGELSTTLALTSPRPVRVSSETSSGLTAWSPNNSEQKQKTGTPGQWNVQTAASGDAKFMKLAARAPEAVPRVSP